MGSGKYIFVVKKNDYQQIDMDQLTYVNTAVENERDLVTNHIKTDFFVGPNGKILPAAFKEWIGTNRRDSLLERVKDEKLRNAINQLYRPGSFIGDGGTASVIAFEKSTGIHLGRKGGTHLQKGKEMLAYLEKKVCSQSLSVEDRKIADMLIADLRKSIGGK